MWGKQRQAREGNPERRVSILLYSRFADTQPAVEERPTWPCTSPEEIPPAPPQQTRFPVALTRCGCRLCPHAQDQSQTFATLVRNPPGCHRPSSRLPVRPTRTDSLPIRWPWGYSEATRHTPPCLFSALEHFGSGSSSTACGLPDCHRAASEGCRTLFQWTTEESCLRGLYTPCSRHSSTWWLFPSGPRILLPSPRHLGASLSI